MVTGYFMAFKFSNQKQPGSIASFAVCSPFHTDNIQLFLF